MTSEITRRAALGFAGATSLTLLAACGSGTAINGSSSESSSAAKKDYKGEVPVPLSPQPTTLRPKMLPNPLSPKTLTKIP